MSDHMRGVCIPDVCPSAILCPPGVETGPEEHLFKLQGSENPEMGPGPCRSKP